MGRRRVESVDDYINEAIVNIRDDRAITSALLTELVVEMKKDSSADTHKDLGVIASKYVETLQRSNEQLVKITNILSKKQDSSVELNESDKEQLFDLIQGDKS
tara:strand:+ start:3804 stop:4112 length:309 start_codon:yes stop_codon:yes gene_type:complete